MPLQRPRRLQPASTTGYLTFDQLAQRYGGISRSWLRRRILHHGFPRPIHLGGSRLRFWRLADLVRWEADRGHHIAPPLNVEPRAD